MANQNKDSFGKMDDMKGSSMPPEAKKEDSFLDDKTTGDIKDNVKSFVSGKAKAVADVVGVDSWNDVKEKAGQVFDKAKHAAGDFGGKVTDVGGQAIEQVTSTVKRYPFPAILVGFGVGAIVGALLANNRRY